MKKFIATLFSLLMILRFSSCASVPYPQVTEGEFPFEIVYEMDGETITVTDVYVCRFSGFSWDTGKGKHRVWDGYIKSSGESELILLEDGGLKLACGVGSPEYYMSDPTVSSEEYVPTVFYVMEPNDVGGKTYGVWGIESLLAQYKIKLISWKMSEPIQNSFE